MKKFSSLLLFVLLTTVLLTAGCFSHRQVAKANAVPDGERKKDNDDANFSAREEITKTIQLPANARVGVYNVNGSVDIVTTDGDQAEIHILRLAHNKEAFEKQKAEIKFKDNKLGIYGRIRQRDSSIWDHITGDDEMRTRVTLKLPRKIELNTSDVNGKVNIGEIDGPVEAHGINGKITIAKSIGSLQFSGINGKVEAGVANLNKDGIELHGINGNVDLKFIDEVNANIEAHGLNGRVNTELPNLQVTEQKHNRYRAKLGSGGPEINVGGMNGNLTLLRAGQTAKVEKKLEAVASPSAKNEVRGS